MGGDDGFASSAAAKGDTCYARLQPAAAAQPTALAFLSISKVYTSVAHKSPIIRHFSSRRKRKKQIRILKNPKKNFEIYSAVSWIWRLDSIQHFRVTFNSGGFLFDIITRPHLVCLIMSAGPGVSFSFFFLPLPWRKWPPRHILRKSHHPPPPPPSPHRLFLAGGTHSKVLHASAVIRAEFTHANKTGNVDEGGIEFLFSTWPFDIFLRIDL